MLCAAEEEEVRRIPDAGDRQSALAEHPEPEPQRYRGDLPPLSVLAVLVTNSPKWANFRHLSGDSLNTTV
jgi:hypothetical protein